MQTRSYTLPSILAGLLLSGCGASSAASKAAPDGSPDLSRDASQNAVQNTDDASDGGGGGGPTDAPVQPPEQDVQCGSTPTGTPPTLTPGQWTNISPTGQYNPGKPTPPSGCKDIHIDPCNPNVLYLTTDPQGLWRSTNAGASWAQIGNLPSPVSPGNMQIDSKNPLAMYYGGGVRGSSLGFWVSTDGGNTWTEPPGFAAQANNSVGGWVNDVYDVKADPADFRHVILTFHSGWEGKPDAGVLESKDGGNTWIRHLPMSGWAAGHTAFFLDNGSTWLLGTQANGFWRTTDSGATWSQVSTQNMQHGGVSAFRANTDVLYVGGLNRIMRSTDDGLTFTLTGPQTQDGYYAIIGDGNQLYAQAANTGTNTTGLQSYITSKESDGLTWSPYNAQTFHDGPYRMAFDSANRIVYSSNWNDGVWALKVN